MPRPAGAIVAVALACACAWPAAAPARPFGAGFELRAGRVKPATAYFDGKRPIKASFTFRAGRRLDLVVRVAHAGSGRVVRRWVRHGLAPGKRHRVRWDGRRADRSVPGDGTYEVRVGPAGHRGATIGRFGFHDHVFPVAGPHTYGDQFGDPRSGGRVQATGYSDALYGYYVLIDGLATHHDYFYAHMQAPTSLSEGERVRTGQRIGYVGKTGNARNEFCQLHFELWPHGYHDGAPVDPAPALREWDAFS